MCTIIPIYFGNKSHIELTQIYIWFGLQSLHHKTFFPYFSFIIDQCDMSWVVCKLQLYKCEIFAVDILLCCNTRTHTTIVIETVHLILRCVFLQNFLASNKFNQKIVLLIQKFSNKNIFQKYLDDFWLTKLTMKTQILPSLWLFLYTKLEIWKPYWFM